MRAEEFVVEGFWGSLFGKNRYAVAAKKSSADQTQVVIGKWTAQLENLKKSNPSMNIDDLESMLKQWADSYFQNSTRIPGPTLTNINDQRSMHNYLSKRMSEFLSAPPAPAPAPAPSEMEVADEIPADGSKLQIKGQGVYQVTGGKWVDPTGNPIDDNVKTDKLSSLYAQSIKAKRDAAAKGATEAPQVVSAIRDNVIFSYQGDIFYKNASNQWEGRKKKNKNLPPQLQKYFNDLEQKVATPVPENKQPLSEGGNVFKDANGVPVTRRIKQAEIMPTVQFLERVTGLDFTTDIDESDGLPKRWLGSTGRKPDSGDLDLAVAVEETSKEQLEQTLKAWCQKQGLDSRQNVKKSGTSVHFNAPILGDPENGTVQTDFMFGDPDWMHFSMQGGRQKHILMASIAKYLGLKWSYANGLSSRMTEQPISGARNPGRIAQILLGPAGRPEDLKSVETIIKKIKNDPEYESMVADARATLGNEGYHLPESMHTSTRKLTKQ